MHVWLFVIVVRFSPGENYLEAETAGRHSRDRDRHGVDEFAMVLLMIVRVFLANPTFEVRDVALQIRHYLRPYNPLFLLEGFIIPPAAPPLA